jgi:hypothetical protein
LSKAQALSCVSTLGRATAEGPPPRMPQLTNSLLLSRLSSPHHSDYQKYSVNHRERDESHHHVDRFHVAQNRDNRRRHKNQVNQHEDKQLFFGHQVKAVIQQLVASNQWLAKTP